MIKINLLESVTERPTGVAMVEDRVANPKTQTLLLALTVSGLLALGIVYDYLSANAAFAKTKVDLEREKQRNQQMLAVNREKDELEKKVADIQTRIDAIKKLRESQQGPGAVLSEIKARFDAVPGLYLRSVEQKDGELTIRGESPNEQSVTKFGQSLEFSSGLFTNLNIETTRETVAAGSGQPAASDPDAPKPEVITFTVKCSYAAAKPKTATAAPQPASQVAQKK
jgi:Tfp pilus assembly protein PilN